MASIFEAIFLSLELDSRTRWPPFCGIFARHARIA